MYFFTLVFCYDECQVNVLIFPWVGCLLQYTLLLKCGLAAGTSWKSFGCAPTPKDFSLCLDLVYSEVFHKVGENDMLLFFFFGNQNHSGVGTLLNVVTFHYKRKVVNFLNSENSVISLLHRSLISDTGKNKQK